MLLKVCDGCFLPLLRSTRVEVSLLLPLNVVDSSLDDAFLGAALRVVESSCRSSPPPVALDQVLPYFGSMFARIFAVTSGRNAEAVRVMLRILEEFVKRLGKNKCQMDQEASK